MGPRYEHFKFEIGDFVQLKQLAGMSITTRKMIVVELMYQECPGGVQLHCRCRNIGFAGLVAYVEIELEPFAETDEEKASKMDWKGMAERAELRAKVRSEFKAGDPPPRPPAPREE